MNRLQTRTVGQVAEESDKRDSWSPKPAILMAAVAVSVSICVGVVVGTSDAVVGLLIVAGH